MNVQKVIDGINKYLYENWGLSNVSTSSLHQWKRMLMDDLKDRRLVTEAKLSAYGYCPHCGKPGISRERRINGNDTCSEGHVYPSTQSKDYMSP